MTRRKRGRPQPETPNPMRRDDRVAIQTMAPLSRPDNTRILMIPNLTEDEWAFLKAVANKALEDYRAIHRA